MDSEINEWTSHSFIPFVLFSAQSLYYSGVATAEYTVHINLLKQKSYITFKLKSLCVWRNMEKVDNLPCHH